MSSLSIQGGHRLSGKVRISGDKISTVHILLMSFFIESTLLIKNASLCGDAAFIIKWLEEEGIKKIFIDENNLRILHLQNNKVSFQKVCKSRASICLLPGVVLKDKFATFYKPKGCNFTLRPIDLHLKLARSLGIAVIQTSDSIKSRLISKKSVLQFSCKSKFGPSVGVTCSALFSSLQLNKRVVLTDIAIEPVVLTICNLLKKIGNKVILDKKNRKVTILKIKKWIQSDRPIVVNIEPDLTETLTLISAAISTKSCIELRNYKITNSVKKFLNDLHINIQAISQNNSRFDCQNVINPRKTYVLDVWPALPSDIGPIICSALGSLGGGNAIIDRVYDKRESHLKELGKLGFIFKNNKSGYLILDKVCIKELTVHASDIRAGASLVVAALGLKKKIFIHNYEQIERGYENLSEKLTSLGANIKIING